MEPTIWCVGSGAPVPSDGRAPGCVSVRSLPNSLADDLAGGAACSTDAASSLARAPRSPSPRSLRRSSPRYAAARRRPRTSATGAPCAPSSRSLRASSTSRASTSRPTRAPPPPGLGDWRAVRAPFALPPGQLRFASFYLASHPRPVREAIEAFRRTLDEEPFLTVEHRMFDPGGPNVQFSIRDEIAPYLGAKRDEIALTGNTTTGLALVYAGLALKAGDEILTTTHHHYSHR